MLYEINPFTILVIITIYDIAVIQEDDYGELIDSVVEPEKLRLLDFINLCNNPGYCMNLLEKWRLML